MKGKSVLIILAAVSLLTSFASAEVDLGSGFKCSGDTILKGTKEVSFSKAKSTLAKTLEKLKSKLENAPKKGKAAIKAQIKAANNSKTLIKACSSGQLSDDQVDPIFTSLASGTGSYTGNYSGNVNGFIPLTGTVTTSFILEGTTFSAVLSIGGNVGSALNAQPLTFSNDVGGIGFPAQFFLTNTFLGDVTLSITQDGHLTITNSNSNNASVTLDGLFSNQSIAITLGGSYSGQTFTGSATLTK